MSRTNALGLPFACAVRCLARFVDLRDKAEAVRQAELARFRNRLDVLGEQERATVEALTKGIVAKLLHEPTVKLKAAATDPAAARLTDALRTLFDL